MGRMNAAGAAGLAHYRRLFGSTQRVGPTLDKALLPTALRYLSERGLLIGQPRGEWCAIRCPIHNGGAETHPSLRVALSDGHFRCMTCGAKGGDVISLHRLLTGATFRQALADLGVRHG